MTAQPLLARWLLAVVVVEAFSVPSAAAAATTGPSITLDRAVVVPGESVIVSMRGFTADVVTLSVCGNLARRGSADCDMAGSVSEERDRFHDVTLSQVFINAPPAPCPCLIRASSNQQRQLAVTPIQITGHPSGPVVGVPSGPLVALSLDVRRAPDGVAGALKSSLGGATRFSVTVSLRNLTTETLRAVRVGGSAGNWFSDEAVSLDLPAPGPLEPGQTWRRRVEAEVPAPMLGRYRWEVVASGAGSPVVAAQTVGSFPWALIVVLLVLAVDMALLAGRFLERRRRRAAAVLA